MKLRTVFWWLSTMQVNTAALPPLYHFSIYSYNDTRTSVSQNMNRGLGMTWQTRRLTIGQWITMLQYIAGYGSLSLWRHLPGSGNGILKEFFDTWKYAYIDNGTASSSTDGLSASGNPHDESRSVSYSVVWGWNWKETYMVNATLRADGFFPVCQR